MAEKFAPLIPRPSPTGIRAVNTLTEFCFSISVVRAFAGGALHEFDAASFGVVLECVTVCHADHATEKSRHCQRRRPGRVFGVCFAHMIIFPAHWLPFLLLALLVVIFLSMRLTRGSGWRFGGYKIPVTCLEVIGIVCLLFAYLVLNMVEVGVLLILVEIVIIVRFFLPGYDNRGGGLPPFNG